MKMFLIVAAIAVLINAAVSFWAYNRYILAAEEEQLNRASLNQATQLSGRVENYLAQLREELQGYTGNQLLLRNLQDNNRTAIERRAATIRRALGDTRTVQFHLAGTAEVGATGDAADDNSSANNDSPVDNALRFSDIDMINRAEEREPVFPEAAQLNNNWYINLVEPIPADDSQPVLATLYTSLPASELHAQLETGDSQLGKAELLQTFDNDQSQLVHQTGQGSAGATQESPIANSHWVIRFTPSPLLVQQNRVDPTGLIAGLAGLLLVSLLFSYILASLLSRKAVARLAQQQEAGSITQARDDSTIADPLHHGRKMLDISDEDAKLPGLDDEEQSAAPDPLDIQPAPDSDGQIPAEIFRAYDIRGLVESQLTPQNVVLIGRAIGSAALDAGDKALAVGRDGRSHSPDIAEQLIEGILSTGCDVINLGMVPTPLVYYAICELESTNSGVVVTASHNPAPYNGFKMVIDNQALAGDQIDQLRIRISRQQFHSGTGQEDFSDLSFQYIDRIVSDVVLAGEVSMVIDAGNGVAGDLAPRLFAELGCEVTALYCDVDGSFPHHEPDPSVPKNLDALIARVQEVGADLGIALDGDGDRVGIVTSSGAIIWPDRLLMLLSKDIVSRHPGADILFDVKSSRELNEVVSSYGGRPIMWKTGHSHMKAKMRETGALLGGELSGHIFIKDRWYGFDDGLYAAARIIEIMSLREQSLDDIFTSFPDLPATPELKVPVEEGKKFFLIEQLTGSDGFDGGRVSKMDGLRVDYPEGWGLVRASNTSPAITLRFEAETDEALQQIQTLFKNELLKVDPSLSLNF